MLRAPQVAVHLSSVVPATPAASLLSTTAQSASQNNSEDQQQEVSATIAAEEPCWAWQIQAKIPLA